MLEQKRLGVWHWGRAATTLLIGLIFPKNKAAKTFETWLVRAAGPCYASAAQQRLCHHHSSFWSKGTHRALVLPTLPSGVKHGVISSRWVRQVCFSCPVSCFHSDHWRSVSVLIALSLRPQITRGCKVKAELKTPTLCICALAETQVF